MGRHHAREALLLIALIAAATGPAEASWDNWNCSLRAYWGGIGGAPQDTRPFLGVEPEATDAYDPDIDAKSAPDPPGPYVAAFFSRPGWGAGPMSSDWRSPVSEGTSKRWGSGLADTWNVKTSLDNGPSGVFDEACDPAYEYPVAASVYVTWQFGVSAGPPHPVPPADYTFTLIYRGGINPKPAGTKLPDAMDPPAVGASWDMNATSYLVLPLWGIHFQPYRPDCSDLAAPDTATFWILVTNPDTVPTCAISVDPTPPQRPPTTFTFTATGVWDEPFIFVWDFGDGASSTDNPVSHTYDSVGTYLVTFSVTDANGEAGLCTTEVEISGPYKEPPTCEITYHPAAPTTDDAVTLDAAAADPDGVVVSVDWEFGDGHTTTGDPSAHQYAMPGTYLVTVTVCDDHGLCTTCAAEVAVGKGANAPPTCNVYYWPTEPRAAWNVTFDARCQDPNPWGVAVSAQWDFGDGATAWGDPTTHAYAEQGVYTVSCMVTDDQGGVGTRQIDVTILSSQLRTIYVDCSSECPRPDGSPQSPYRLIQDAIDAATDGDTVLVLPCTYYENVDFLGKAITVTGLDPLDPAVVAATVIDGGGLGTVVELGSVEDKGAALKGFTITNGAASYGGGIVCVGSPTIAYNVITANSAERCGGGVRCVRGSSPSMTNNFITANNARSGGGVYSYESRAMIAHNVIADNSAYSNGGGIYCNGGVYRGRDTIANNLISGNSSREFGGGICCEYSSANIVHNRIATNRAGGMSVGRGGGVACLHSSPRIAGNSITANSADYVGGGICCWVYSSPNIAGNNIARNNTDGAGGGVFCGPESWPNITNNTVVANDARRGAGLYWGISPPSVSNNVVAFNASGICQDMPGSATLRNNCVYNPDGEDYSGLEPGAGDISADPRFVALDYGDLHIQPDSPCVDAGWNGAPALPASDMDGEPRVQGAAVDIGADESDGTWHEFLPVIVRVAPWGDDANDGSSWPAAKRTVQDGIDAASVQGGEVWVAAGTYHERIALRTFTYVYGGFAGTENAREDRDWNANSTILDGGQGGSVVTAGDISRFGAIDGFTIGNGSAGSGAGILCYRSSPAICNNSITANSAAYNGGGILLASSSSTVFNNTVAGNSAGRNGGGIFCDGLSSPAITNNTIIANTARNWGGGIHCEFLMSWPNIANNVIAANSAEDGGGGICCGPGIPTFHATVTNNTIVDNSAPRGGGLFCFSSRPVISNNILAFNSSGVLNGWAGAPSLYSNCVYNPDGVDYYGLDPGEGDFSADPLFVDRPAGDYHLLPTSPCIDAGWNDAPGVPATDIDGDPRPWPVGGAVDIGADERVNHPPHCDIMYEPAAPAANQEIAFHSNAHDPEGAAVACMWDFGDGAGGGGCDLVHTYAAPGTYRIGVTVTDANGGTATCQTDVVVTPPGEADCEVSGMRASPRGRVGRLHHVVVMLRNWGPDSCQARLRLRNLGTHRIIEERIVDLAAPKANGRSPVKVEMFSHRWQPADRGWCELEASVTPLGARDPRLQNNIAVTEVKVRP